MRPGEDGEEVSPERPRPTAALVEQSTWYSPDERRGRVAETISAKLLAF